MNTPCDNNYLNMENYMICEFVDGETENNYKLISVWQKDYINLNLIGFKSVWISRITLANTSIWLSNLRMNYDDYRSTFMTLFDPESFKQFKLVFENGTLKWFKVVDQDVSIIYGLFVFTKITDCEMVIEILEPLSTNFIKLKDQINKLQEENCKIKNELSIMAVNFQQCAEKKLNLENTLCTKFLNVLQKKNATIQNLKGKLPGEESDDKGKEEKKPDCPWVYTSDSDSDSIDSE